MNAHVSHRRDGLVEHIRALLKAAMGGGRPHDSMVEALIGLQEDMKSTMGAGKSLALSAGHRLYNSPFFHTPLDLVASFKALDAKRKISSRRHVAPTFSEIREMLNLAQLTALTTSGGERVELICFDGDQTLYTHNTNLSPDSPMVSAIVAILRKGIKLSLVTAAGYPGKPERYAERVSGILDRLRTDDSIPAEICSNFYVMGGECNYLLQFDTSASHCLRPIPRETWETKEMASWSLENIRKVLDVAERSLREYGELLDLKPFLIRKERAVGIIPCPKTRGSTANWTREALDDIVLETQGVLRDLGNSVPACAFHSHATLTDSFVDIGRKAHGIKALQGLFGVPAARCVHFGDQFLATGNDIASRAACPTVWVDSPDHFLKYLQWMEANL